jgi:PAS domain S-box-containing protein
MEAPPLADARTILAAIVSSSQSNIFLVDVGPNDGFFYVPLDGLPWMAEQRPLHRDSRSPQGRTPEERFGADDGAAVRAHYRDCIAADGPVVYEEMLHAGGAERWWQTSLTPIRNRGGAIVQILGISIDITERKRVETKLRATERQFQTIVANVPGVVYRRILHPDGRISYPYLSEGVKRLLGVDAEAVRADPSLMLGTIDPRDKPMFDREIERSARELSSYELEMRNITTAGEERWVRSVAQTSRLEDGSIVWNGLILDITDRKRAERELLERDARLRDFAAASSDWLWEMGADLRFTRMSERFFAIYGISTAQVIGKRWDEIADASHDVEVWGEMLDALAEHRPFRDLVFRRWIRGFPVGYVKISGRPVFDERGAFAGFRGTGTDLTAQHVAEQRAAAASSRLINAIESLSEGVAIFDPDDALVMCNARYREISGGIAEFLVPGARFADLLRKGIAHGLYPDAIGNEEGWLRQRLVEHLGASGSFEQRMQDGEWLQVLEQRTPDGGIMILETDITEMKRREMALTVLTGADQEGSAFFEDAVRALAAGLGYRYAGIAQLIDGGHRLASLAFCDGDMVLANTVWDIAGTPCEEVLRRGTFLAVSREIAGQFPQALRLPALGAVSYVGDIITDAAGGKIGIVFGIDDKPDAKCLKRRDITSLIAARVSLELQRRDAEMQLRQAKETAEVASRAKSEFLANMSHELRTPLNAVIGFSQMIGEEILGPVGRPEYKEYARDIHNSSLHLLQIINDILDVSKIEAGMATLHGAEVDYATVAAACCRLVSAKAKASEIALSLEMASDLPMIWADERMLKQVTLNLLSNALKFTPKGGAVALSAARHGGGGLVIRVSDTGIGIAPEDFDKVFRPFGQVDSSLSRRFEGTGLGLPLTKGLVELHGGTITLESEVGRGTTVSVYLPPRQR